MRSRGEGKGAESRNGKEECLSINKPKNDKSRQVRDIFERLLGVFYVIGNYAQQGGGREKRGNG